MAEWRECRGMEEEFEIYEKICSLIINNNPKLNEIEKTAYLHSIQRIISTMPYDCKIPRFSLNDEDFTINSAQQYFKEINNIYKKNI